MPNFSYNTRDEDALSDNPNPKDAARDRSRENREMEEFFERLPSNFRWPKPNPEAVAAAVEAIQRMSGGSSVAQDLAAAGDESQSASCEGCRAMLPPGAKFCPSCGLPPQSAASSSAQSGSAATAQHHIHHHYHHVLSSSPAVPVVPGLEADPVAPRGRVPTANAGPIGRAEIAARQVAQDWAQACNTRHIDDLLELYAADATVIRSSVPPVRSLPAIREFLLSMLEAGLGEVEMESLRLEMMGDIALDLGRCKMLVPVAMGKRREERGKYMIVLVRQPAGTWKILADCWSSDLPVTAPPPAHDATARKAPEPPSPARKQR